MSKRRLNVMGMAALALSVAAITTEIPNGVATCTEADPFKPRRRSKGEKARNRRNR